MADVRLHKLVKNYEDTPAVRGMLYKVVHLVKVTAKTGEMPLSSRAKARSGKKASK